MKMAELKTGFLGDKKATNLGDLGRKGAGGERERQTEKRRDKKRLNNAGCCVEILSTKRQWMSQ